MTAPLCPICGEPKQLRETRGPKRSRYWRCADCANERQRIRYRFRRANGLSDSGVPLKPPVLLPPQPKEEKPRLRCWREKQDYWAAWKHISGAMA
jgi:hypothetical protein